MDFGTSLSAHGMGALGDDHFYSKTNGISHRSPCCLSRSDDVRFTRTHLARYICTCQTGYKRTFATQAERRTLPESRLGFRDDATPFSWRVSPGG